MYASACATLACKGEQTQRAQPPDSTLPGMPSRAQAPVTGPRLIVDSAASSATVEIQAGEYIVRLPAAMARTLFDSLPGFAPLPRAAYPEGIKKWVESSDTLAVPLSVVAGDFDGDSVSDVAMIGGSRDTLAVTMLLSNASSPGKPRLLFLGQRWAAKFTDPQDLYLGLLRPSRISDEFVLRTDAVRVEVFEKTGSVYYLEGGKLRDFSTSEE
jgi:hypothetical protein